MFDVNFLVVILNVVPARKLQCRFHILNYHFNRESQSKGIVKFMHMNGNDDPSDIVTKSRASNTCFPLMKHIFSGVIRISSKSKLLMRRVKKRSSTPPIYQSKVTPQQSFKLYLWHILGDYGHDPLLYHVYVSFSLEDTPEPQKPPSPYNPPVRRSLQYFLYPSYLTYSCMRFLSLTNITSLLMFTF